MRSLSQLFTYSKDLSEFRNSDSSRIPTESTIKAVIIDISGPTTNKFSKPQDYIPLIQQLISLGYKVAITTDHTEIDFNLTQFNCHVDVLVTREKAAHPFSTLKSMELLGVAKPRSMIRISGIFAGIKEGLELGCWTASLVDSKSDALLSAADYSIKTPLDLLKILPDIQMRMQRGELPNGLTHKPSPPPTKSTEQTPVLSSFR